MGSPANSSSLITSSRNPWPLPPSACSQPSLLRLMPSPRLRLMPTMAPMAMALAMLTAMVLPTVDTTAMVPIPMPTMDTTTARGPLMPRLRPPLRPLLLLRLTLMLTMVSMAMEPTVLAMPTVMDTPEPTDMDMATTPMPLMPILMPTTDSTTARGPLMPRPPPLLRPMLMLTTDTTPTPMPMVTVPTDMPTVVTTATPTVTDGYYG